MEYLTRSELYAMFVDSFDALLKEEGRPISDLNTPEFGLSERQYYYIKRIALNPEDTADRGLSENRIREIAERLGFEIHTRYLKR